MSDRATAEIFRRLQPIAAPVIAKLAERQAVQRQQQAGDTAAGRPEQESS